jgi:hypothetical protein
VKHHHFKLQLRHIHCESTGISCIDREYDGDDKAHFSVTETSQIDDCDLEDLEIEGIDICFSLPKQFDSSDPIFDKFAEQGLDPDEVAEMCHELIEAEECFQEPLALEHLSRNSSAVGDTNDLARIADKALIRTDNE